MKLLKKYLFIEVTSSLLLVMTLIIFGPLEILLSQPVEFWFSIKDVMWIILFWTILFFIVCMALFLVFSNIGEGLLKVVISMISAIGVCTYIQGNWTFIDYGNMDGTPINWSNYSKWSVINTIIWIILIIVIICLIFFKDNTRVMCAYLFIGIVGIEVLTLATLAINNIGNEIVPEFTLDGIGEFELSKDNNNIIVILADGFDGTDFIPVLEEQPDFREYFDGFTFYEDTCGTSLWSEESGITLLTGNQFEVGKKFEDNVKKAYQDSDLYNILTVNNYKSYLYCEEKMVSPEISSKIANYNYSRSTIGNIMDATRCIYKMVAFRYAPHIVKQRFCYSTQDFSNFKGGESRLWCNYDVYDYLDKYGIRTNETNSNIYQFFWIQGPHEPANTDRYCRKVETVISMDDADYSDRQFEQTIGVVRLFTKLIDSLKRAGIYDNTTIILAADHGWDIRPNPLLLIKPFNAQGELAVSDAPVSMISDYIPTLEYFISGQDNGNTIYDLSENQERDRLFYVYDINSEDRTYNSRETCIYEQGVFIKKLKCGMPISADEIEFYAVKGFSDSESSHIWTVGNESELKFNIDDEFNNLKLDLNYITYNGEQPVELYINDNLVEKFIAQGEENRSIIIPGKYVTDGNLKIKMLFSNAVAPCDVDANSSDVRVLALAFRSICISNTDSEPSE